MIITITCEDCQKKISIKEPDIYKTRKDGSYVWIYARNDKDTKLGYREVNLCPKCRPPINTAGKIYVTN